MAEEYILAGRVSINGSTVTKLGTVVNEGDIVTVDSNKISSEETVYIMLNKPKGYISTASEQFGRRSVMNLVKDIDARLFPVGRLDMFSEGMLLLTNDGDFTNRIIHPTKHIKKTYEVLLNKEITKEDISRFEQGVDIGDYITKKAEVTLINKGKIHISIYEGKNRQVRRMVDALGYKVINLKRISIGNLEMGSLKMGTYKKLSKKEIDKIFE